MSVANGCNENTSSDTNLGNAYVKDTEINGQQVFTGEYSFQVKQIEFSQPGSKASNYHLLFHCPGWSSVLND
jgi:hypothetical protein